MFFITSQELLDMYPTLTTKQREYEITKKHKTVFIMEIGYPLTDGIDDAGRSPDYDDWTMNGDIMFWDDVLDCAMEISSMGVRVSPESLDRQLTLSGHDERRKLPPERHCGPVPGYRRGQGRLLHHRAGPD